MAAESTQGDTHDKAWEKAEKKFTHKHASEYYDPCQDFADRSLKCMKRNAFDREMCHDYFQYVENPYVIYLKDRLALRLAYLAFDPLLTSLAYRDCKKNWLTQKKVSLTPQPK
ncbi:hypothetical protein E8E15_008323 [Penicillium rubens]|uniref:uncharacterized protein n=1 Tax=Penicillium rubens TaxID=1108849 RepID=UPI001D363B32|nr:uncharacterized protein N7525_004471 [Penicillium rubens]KAF3029329.1 hypothetical protein E8E15_008323 [Penicillium rubens]KAJ5839283.1 hypothetical protein N7525_004471 [Penicillium rubens]KAJ5867335.1 hypothetical protein N7534_001888 [Penicillium rubens]